MLWCIKSMEVKLWLFRASANTDVSKSTSSCAKYNEWDFWEDVNKNPIVWVGSPLPGARITSNSSLGFLRQNYEYADPFTFSGCKKKFQ